LRPPELLESPLERREIGLSFPVALSIPHQHADQPQPLRLLRPRHERPRGRAAEQRDELATLHSITSSYPPFAERVLRNAAHSGLMLPARITLAHFSVSAASSFPNSSGVIGIGTPPSSAKRAFSRGSARTAFTARFSVSMTSAGVPLGATIPLQTLTS